MDEQSERKGKMLKYRGVINGKIDREFDVFKPDGDVEQTQECAEWWKANYTVENGAFWYKIA